MFSYELWQTFKNNFFKYIRATASVLITFDKYTQELKQLAINIKFTGNKEFLKALMLLFHSVYILKLFLTI